MFSTSPASDQGLGCRTHPHRLEGTCCRLIYFVIQFISFYFNGSLENGVRHTTPLQPHSLETSQKLLWAPDQPCRTCPFLLFILFFFCYLQSSPGIMSTLSRVIHNYIRCHLLERTVTCRTNLYSTSHVPNYLKKKNKKTNINHAYREFLILLGPSRDKKGPLREHLFHLFGLI